MRRRKEGRKEEGGFCLCDTNLVVYYTTDYYTTKDSLVTLNKKEAYFRHVPLLAGGCQYRF